MTPVVDLTALLAVQGFVIQGDAAGDRVGFSVSAAGDVNGDGIDDLIVGAPYGVDGGRYAGEAYVIFGTAGATRGRIDLTTLAAGDGFIVQGSAISLVGFQVSGGGDVNGDGIDDLIVGAPLVNYGGGGAYVIFGKVGATRSTVDLTGLAASDGFFVKGANENVLVTVGRSVSSAGDINGDGLDDLIIGAVYGIDGVTIAGQAYVVFGKTGATRGQVDLGSLAASDGFLIQGEVNGYAGWSVAASGDVNGDGLDDLIVGAPGDSSGAYVVFGKAGATRGPIDLASLAASDGLSIRYDTERSAGVSVASAGDINGDGIADLIIGAPDEARAAGEAFVIFGTTGTSRSVIDLANLAATDGFIIRGDSARDALGVSVASAGDFNGDGIDDLIVGASFGDDGGTDAGEAYVIFGKAGATRDNIDLTGLAAGDGFIVQGDAAGDWAGWSVAAAGDVNADGFDDLIVGAPRGDDGGSNAGEVYVIFGTANQPPRVTTGIADQASLEDAPWSFTVPAGSFSDPDGDSLAYAARLADGSPLPAWLGFDSATRTFSGTPPRDFNGSIDLEVTATARGVSIGDVFSLTITPVSDARIFVGTSAGDVFVAPADPNDRWTVDGRAGADDITTADGSDTIIGGWGNDTIRAGGGDDFIIFDIAGSASDLNMIDGGAGYDELRVLADNAIIGLAGIANIERINGNGHANVVIQLGRSGDLLDFTDTTLVDIARIRGGAGNDTIIGAAGNDIIDGEAGNDSLSGANGDDMFLVSGNVTLDRFDGGAGTDTIRALANNSRIGAGTFANVEIIDASGFSGVGIFGGTAADIVDLSGVTLFDVALIDASAGNDTVTGSAGADRIKGGIGSDVITGGLGGDVFAYDAASHSTAKAADFITDFAIGIDLIDLTGIDADTTTIGNQTFQFIGDSIFSRTAGELQVVTDAITGTTTIRGDTNGDGRADLQITLTGGLAVTETDFLL